MAHMCEKWPGGIQTVSGGTRNEVKLSRPWQVDILINPDTCPFCKNGEERTIFAKGGWWLFNNLFTPFRFHQLIMPNRCLRKEEVRILGGYQSIVTVFEIAQNVIQKDKEDFSIGTHVGPLAGQNLSHLHYHLLKPFDSQNSLVITDEFEDLRKNYSYLIFEQDNWVVIAGGFRAGQCFILPASNPVPFNQRTIKCLARVLTRIIALYNTKFLSTQGLPPDYRITVRIRNGEIFAGWYVPVLNHWGFTEDSALLERQPIVLPWPHEVTVKFLKGK